jgi:glycosyltransferase involved in cell wall biosynthesis
VPVASDLPRDDRRSGRAGRRVGRRLLRRPLKVLLVNYRYFVSGGPERYLFNVSDLLESNGHQVVPFSIRYERNEPTPYDKYFASPLSDESEVYFKEQSKDVGTVAKSLERAFYSREVYRQLARLIDDERPDVALVLHYLRKLSPAVTKCLHDHRVPFVVRISDFGMVCPNAHLFRDGHVCELCVGGSLRNSVRYRCVQGSLGASAVNYAATRFHQAMGYYDLVKTFAVPSQFTLEKMVEGGISRDRLVHLPTFVQPGREVDSPGREPVVVYVGRIDELKGVGVLLEAVRALKSRPGLPAFRTRIIGFGAPGYVAQMKAFAHDNALADVSFESGLTEDAVRAALRSAQCSVAPSLWYDNMPNAVLESFAEGTPVIGSRHGSIPELIHDGDTGLLVQPGDATALADALADLLAHSARAAELGTNAVRFVTDRHSPELHYRLLTGIFENIAASND